MKKGRVGRGDLRLFGAPSRIPVRMSANISCPTLQRSSSIGTPAMSGPTLFFSTLMADETNTIARGLQRRDGLCFIGHQCGEEQRWTGHCRGTAVLLHTDGR